MAFNIYTHEHKRFRELAKEFGVPDTWRSFSIHVAMDETVKVTAEWLAEKPKEKINAK